MTRSGQSRVAAMCAGNSRGWPMSTIIFQTPYLRPGAALFHSWQSVWGFPPAATNWMSCIWALYCFCTTSAITFKTWLCHKAYFDSDAVQFDRIFPRVLRFPHWVHWAESAAFHLSRSTGFGKRSYTDPSSILILDGCSPFRFVQERYAGYVLLSLECYPYSLWRYINLVNLNLNLCCLEEVPYCFSKSTVKFQGHTTEKSSILTQIGRSRTVTPVRVHWWLWNDVQGLKQHWRGALLFFKVICHISRSQWTKTADFDLNWAFPDCNLSLNLPMTLKWCTKLNHWGETWCANVHVRASNMEDDKCGA